MRNSKTKIYLSLSVVFCQFFISCNKDSIDKVNDPIPYEAVGGYANSDEIAPNNLVSKLSFENNFTDSKSNITSVIETNIGYTSGIKGNAYNGSSSQERYAVANASNAITSLNNYTISFWIKTLNTVDPSTPGQGKGAQGIFTIVRPLEFWGGLNLFIENPDSAFPNRIRLKLGVENGRAGVAWRGQSVIMNIDNNIDNWIHVAFTYDSSTSLVSGYLNGQPAVNLSGFAYAPAGGIIGSAPWFADNPGGLDNPNNAPKYGVFEMTATNGKVVFGTHQFETTPSQNNGSQQDWATSFAGLMDEFRIYNIPLPAKDIKSLYLLEKDNR